MTRLGLGLALNPKGKKEKKNNKKVQQVPPRHLMISF
jgi:hypothetical protein